MESKSETANALANEYMTLNVCTRFFIIIIYFTSAYGDIVTTVPANAFLAKFASKVYYFVRDGSE